MNKQKILDLATLLRSPQVQDHFHMGSWVSGEQSGQPITEALHTCGTTACIAGWAVAMDSPDWQVNDTDNIPDVAQDILGLTALEASQLFTPYSYEITYSKVTNEIAADVLEHLAKTGRVRWPKKVRWSNSDE